ncbi:MAG: hypothetical protein LBS50_09295 [Prevotellaceae bacterium]|jgi:hypothetical protein|nr:hypothetical protein [Prevotellaceae bacterium]
MSPNSQNLSEKIYQASNGGLDILKSLYEIPLNSKQAFMIHPERSPSAYLKHEDGIWHATDFGGDGHMRNAIEWYMHEHNLSWKDALKALGAEYGVLDGNFSFVIAKPDIVRRQPTDREIEGFSELEIRNNNKGVNKESSVWFADWEFNDKFTAAELAIWGNRVTQEILDGLGWHSVKWKSTTSKKSGKLTTTVVSSNDTYPVFARECRIEGGPGKEGTGTSFFKFYQPLAMPYEKEINGKKAFFNNKWEILPKGAKERNYICGLIELKAEYDNFNEKEREIFDLDEKNEGKTYKNKRLPAVILCSGERDSANCKAYGYCPVWLNSESDVLTKHHYFELKKYAEKIYNIPDIDSTGIKAGRRIAEKYIDIYTVKLPKWLLSKKHNGKKCKDLTDFLREKKEQEDFENLLRKAMPFQFWEYVEKYNEKSGRTQKILKINSIFLQNFITESGFAKIVDRESKKEKFIKITENIVSEVLPQDIRNHCRYFIEDLPKTTDNVFQYNIEVLNYFLDDNKRTSVSNYNDLPVVELDFRDNDRDRQFLYFKNSIVEVTANEISVKKYDTTDKYVWEDKIAPFDFKRLEKSFDVVTNFNRTDNFSFDKFEMLAQNSHFQRFIINTSRIHWRKEFEDNMKNADGTLKYTPEQISEYKKVSKFNLLGGNLTDIERFEQIQNFIAKCYVIGYMLHRYKDFSKAMCVWAMEEILISDNDSSGGSGKSFFMQFLQKDFTNLKKHVYIDGRDPKKTEDKHLFEQVDKDTDLLFIDDLDKYFDFNNLYAKITNSITINPKQIGRFTLSFKNSPKIVVTSNYAPRNYDNSTARRLLFAVFSDWYHHDQSGNYNECRTLKNDFGYSIGDEQYKVEYWNEDFNFLVDCLQFYLKNKDYLIQPPLANALKRINYGEMGDQFRDWAEVFFAQDGENVNVEIRRDEIFDDFLQTSKVKGWTSKRFGTALRAFCKVTNYIECLNPEEMCNAFVGDKKIRIMKNVDVGLKKISKEFYYIKTKN